MNRKWHLIYYETIGGECPVQKFIDSRKDREQAKIFAWLSQLEDKGPNLPRPYADLLIDGIHELRVRLSGDQIRILYFFCHKNYIVLTHAFRKLASAVPVNEIKRSQAYRTDFLSRFTEKKLKEVTDEDV